MEATKPKDNNHSMSCQENKYDVAAWISCQYLETTESVKNYELFVDRNPTVLLEVSWLNKLSKVLETSKNQGYYVHLGLDFS